MRIIYLFNDFKKIFFKQKRSNLDYNYVLRSKKFSSSRRQKIEHKYINNISRKNDVDHVLDYGCNDGRLALSIDKNIKYYGVDINTNLKKSHMYSKNIRIYKNKIYIKKKFNCIILSHVIGHLDNPINIIKELSKNLKKNGIILIITPNKYFKFLISFKNLFNNYLPDNTVFKYYSKAEIIDILQKINLKLIYFKKYSIQKNFIRERLIGERLLFVVKK